MKTLFHKLVIVVLIMSGAVVTSLAQSVGGSLFFLKVDGIKGESMQQGHVDEIDAFSFKLGVSQRGVSDFGGGGGAGKSQFLPLVVYKNVDISSPALFFACASGQHIKKVELKATQSGAAPGEDYLVITLTDVLVSSLNHESADNGGTTTVLESLSLNFAKIEISYRRLGDGGLEAPVKSGFDVKANKKL